MYLLSIVVPKLLHQVYEDPDLLLLMNSKIGSNATIWSPRAKNDIRLHVGGNKNFNILIIYQIYIK